MQLFPAAMADEGTIVGVLRVVSVMSRESNRYLRLRPRLEAIEKLLIKH